MLLMGLQCRLQTSTKQLSEVLQQQELMLSFTYFKLVFDQHTTHKKGTSWWSDMWCSQVFCHVQLKYTKIFTHSFFMIRIFSAYLSSFLKCTVYYSTVPLRIEVCRPSHSCITATQYHWSTGQPSLAPVLLLLLSPPTLAMLGLFQLT